MGVLMKHRKVFLIILIFSICLTVFGFLIDSDEYIPDLVQNALDFLLMTTLFFGFFSIVYLIGFFLLKWIARE
jgi:hypothetical protein